MCTAVVFQDISELRIANHLTDIKNAGNGGWTDDLLHAQNMDESSALPKNLYPTLFVGQSDDVGLYALPAYVDEKTITIAPKYLGPPLLEGPMPIQVDTSAAERNMPRARPVLLANSELYSTTYKTVDKEYLLLGYHEPPQLSTKHLVVQTMDSGRSMDMSMYRGNLFIDYVHPQDEFVGVVDGGEVVLESRRTQQCANGRCKPIRRLPGGGRPLLPAPDRRIGSNHTEDDDEDWGFEDLVRVVWNKYPRFVLSFFVVAFIGILFCVWSCGHTFGLNRSRTYSHSSYVDVSQASRSSRGSARGNNNQDDIFDDTDVFHVGKLQFDPKAILGRGCQGTVVYKGFFDGREVAVKRVLSDCIDLIDREVNHLRESDSHQNVIRYFCTESDDSFRYIALELCECDLDIYVKNKEIRVNYEISELAILKQASEGIAHLHSIKIVHRDVKPKNILMNNRNGNIRVLISDFGFCKKIKQGHNSISMMSGMAGTVGWMAPECIQYSDCSVTCAVDVFSLGCIFYYVLSDGDHPFGEDIRRQDCILREEPNLEKLLLNHDNIALSIIEPMLDKSASRRPNASAVAMHPLFWSPDRQLQFLMDVSDRIEKEDDYSLPVQRLERHNHVIVKRNWIDQLSKPLQEDLTKFRSYKRGSVRDLLRAMRNKKHHYNELSKELRQSLGRIPNEYLVYFTSKFPMLLMHVYKAMTVCADESIFARFYPPELKLFYDRVVLEENETYYVTSRSPKHKRMGFPTSQPPPGYRITHTSSQPQFQERIPYSPAAPSVPFPHKFASDADLAEWRTPSPAADSDARMQNRSPVHTPLPPQPIFALVTNSTTPSNKNHKNKKKKKKAPFSALAELDGINDQEPLVQEEESNEEQKTTQKAGSEEAEDITHDQERRPTRELSSEE
ncbi:protein kinase domain-containing protein [Ditylenchus destructor]|nr:protein kinase domain-containing protein [Ditylenchus destructor]